MNRTAWAPGASTNAAPVTVGAAESTVTASAAESPDAVPFASTWRAVIACVPSASAAEPLVVTTVVPPVATALPMGAPSAETVTVAPASVPPTWNCSALAGAALLSRVTLSVSDTPESEAGSRSGADGAAGPVRRPRRGLYRRT